MHTNVCVYSVTHVQPCVSIIGMHLVLGRSLCGAALYMFELCGH